MPQKDIALMAHLMRRAGFGATRNELEAYVSKGYEATVEELLYPGGDAYLDKDVVDSGRGRLQMHRKVGHS